LCTLPHPNGVGTAPFGLPLCPSCPVLPRPRMTGHRLTWRPSFDSASAHWASVEASPDLTAVHVLLCRRLSTRHADVGRYRWQRDGKWRMIATSQRRPRRRRRGVLRLQHQHHFTSPTARRCVCQAVCGQVDGLSFFCAGQSGAKNNVSRHRAIAHIAGGWYGVVRCDRPPPADLLHLCRAVRTRRTAALSTASSGGVMEPVSCRLACPGRCGGRWPLRLFALTILCCYPA
jgi:hypothetical protein